MPTYEYACKSCGQHIDVVQSFTDDALTECPNCGGPLRKVFGNIGISFKGSGFYKNDSRSSTNGNAGSTAPASTSSSTTEGGSSGGSTDGGGSSSKPSSDGGSTSGGSSTPAPAPAAATAAS